MFITKDDIHTKIMPHELDSIIGLDNEIVLHAISSAISEIRGYLIGRYDTEAIFSKTGNNRHALLVSFACDIAVYEIVAIALPGQDLEDRRARYKRAIDWLKQLAAGIIQADLPLADGNGSTGENGTDINNRGPFAFSSQNKRRNSF